MYFANYRRYAFVLIVLFILSFVILLNFLFKISANEVLWKISPDKTLKAVIVEISGGVATNPTYDVLIRPAPWTVEGTKVATLFNSARNQHSYGVNLCWKSNNNLVIYYYQADKLKLFSEMIKIDNHDIVIAINEGIIDNAAPPGYMDVALQNFHYTNSCDHFISVQ